MKKILSLTLVLVMVMSLFSVGAAAEASNIKVGFIFLHDENSGYDLNFMNAATAACEKMGVEYEFRTNVDETNDCYEAAADMADSGCSIVFADSFGHEGFLIQAAQEYPDVQFYHATGTRAHNENLANFHDAFASIYEGRYLAGVAAGLKLNEMIEAGEFTAEEAKMGYVGAFTYAEIISGYTAFYLGAKSVCPTVTMDVTFTGSWLDETLEKEGANKLIEAGCKLISQHADSMGAPTACENAGVPNVAYNGSTISVAPNTYIVSSAINWVPFFEAIITAAMNGETLPSDIAGTLATSDVVLSEINEKAAAAGTAEKLAEVRAAIESGELKVFDVTTFTVSMENNPFKTDTLTVDENGMVISYLADVDSDANYTGDTEVIADGYFHESEFRSAPYFDLNIDGINLLEG